MKRVIDKITDHRFLFFLILFVICVTLELHGSSIGMYDRFIDNKIDNSKEEIIGISRGIRSDEWMVHTPYYFSQVYNKFDKYSNYMSLNPQNMILGYNSPVKDITMIGKPLTFGYMLFGRAKGLSWYWCLKLFILILASYEFIFILTKNKRLSIVGTLLIAFSPVLQWWFVPHITDVFIWSLVIISLTYRFFTEKIEYKKNILTILITSSLIGYALALFPSCQVPLAFISLALTIGLLIRDREDISFTKKDIFRIIFVFLVTLSVLGYFVATSIEDLKLFTNTVYPGSRISVGGDSNFTSLFTDLTTIFLPYKTITYLNNSEASTFIHLGPIALIIYPLIITKINKKDKIIGNILYVMSIVEILFMLVGFPKIIAKITFFSYINRMHIIYGFTVTLFTIYLYYIIDKEKIKFKNKTVLLIVLSYIIVYTLTLDKARLEFLPAYIYVIELIYIAVLSILYLKNKKISQFMFILLIVIGSFPINPISKGITGITNHPESKVISKLKGGYFLAADGPIYANYLLANGAKVINATNMYPDFQKWKILDKKEKNKFYYNRYANMYFEFTHGKTTFDLKADDTIYVKLNYRDIKKLKVKYIFTLENIEADLEEENIQNKVIYENNQTYIYEIIKESGE